MAARGREQGYTTFVRKSARCRRLWRRETFEAGRCKQVIQVSCNDALYDLPEVYFRGANGSWAVILGFDIFSAPCNLSCRDGI